MEKEHFNKNANASITIETPKKNSSIAHFEMSIDELMVKGISLKGVKASGHADISDENVRIQCDTTLKFIMGLLGEFGGSVNKLFEASISAAEARTEKCNAETEEIRTRTAKYKAETEEIQARTENIRRHAEKSCTNKL